MVIYWDRDAHTVKLSITLFGEADNDKAVWYELRVIFCQPNLIAARCPFL